MLCDWPFLRDANAYSDVMNRFQLQEFTGYRYIRPFKLAAIKRLMQGRAV